MKLSIVNKDGTVLHTLNTELRRSQAGVAVMLLLFLYTVPTEQRDAFITYFLDASVDDPQVLADVLKVKKSTVVDKFRKAKAFFRELVKKTNGKVLVRDDLVMERDTKGYNPDDSVPDVIFGETGVTTWGMGESNARNLLNNSAAR